MATEGLDHVRRAFKEWREIRVGRERIPETLWELCIRVCKVERISKVAKAARVDYYALRRKVEKSKSPLTVSQLNQIPASPPSTITVRHPSGWSLELNSQDPMSCQWLHTFLNLGNAHAASVTTDSDLSGSPTRRLSKGNRVTRRVCLGATAD
jgi:hypothetical protein